jgi:ABC-2 type transport system ATP-binding protein
MELFKIKDLVKKYNHTVVINSMNFEINQGDFIGLLGPNGAGKTTLIRILLGLIEKTSGEIYYKGQKIENMAMQDRYDFGVILENHGLYETLSVFNNLYFYSSLYNIDNIIERIREVLAKVKLSDKENIHVRSLSKGQKQRVAIARSLLHDPGILILDEPALSLDPEGISLLRNLLLDLNNNHNKTILISSHDLSEIENMCKRVILINKGKKIIDDNTKDIIKNYSTPTVSIQDIDLTDTDIDDLLNIKGVLNVQYLGKNCLIMIEDMDISIAIQDFLYNRKIYFKSYDKKLKSLEEIYLDSVREED